ncbi:MAG: methyltransferase domain-containing protein [Bacillota bacterium]|nr:methyltransferase domain-containing protein [Bacillota bacterium]
MDFKLLKTAGFWRSAWEEALKNSLWAKRTKDSSDFWNKIALTYGQERQTKEKDRLEAVMEILETQGILNKDSVVLDIGCGPGVYALRMASKVKQVVALDNAEKMLEVLEEKAKGAGLTNITTVVLPWEEVDLEKMGWSGYFDLVFASITPAIRDPETFLKMLAASRNYCCLIEFAGGYYNPVFAELWELIFKEAYPGGGFEVIYPLNFLLALGYLPSLRFIDDFWKEERPAEEAIESLCASLGRYTDVTPEIKQIISDYIQKQSKNGIYHRKVLHHLGIIFWEVNKKLSGWLPTG